MGNDSLWIRGVLLGGVIVLLAACTDPRAGIGIGIGPGGVSVNPVISGNVGGVGVSVSPAIN